MLAGTTTPDGYQVNADGAWVEGGVVKTQGATVGAGNNTLENQENTTGWFQTETGEWKYRLEDGSLATSVTQTKEWQQYYSPDPEEYKGSIWQEGIPREGSEYEEYRENLSTETYDNAGSEGEWTFVYDAWFNYSPHITEGNGWNKTERGYWRYVDSATGQAVTGRVEIDGRTFNFDYEGDLMSEMRTVQQMDKLSSGKPTNGGTSISESDLMQASYKMVSETDTYYLRFVKAKLEETLRASGIMTPGKEYIVDGVKTIEYSKTGYPYYTRGVRKGEIDTYGLSGVKPGDVADKTTYGPQIVGIEIGKTTEEGNTVTNGEIIERLLQYYKDNPHWTFGGLDRVIDNGDGYTFYIYAHKTVYSRFTVYGDSEEDTVTYRREEFDPEDESFAPYYIFVRE